MSSPDETVMDEFHPVLARLRIAALQSQVLAKTQPSSVVRSQRSKVVAIKDPAGGWKLGKKRVVRARSNSSSS